MRERYLKSLEFARKHIFLTSIHHFCGGFGLAIVIQNQFSTQHIFSNALGWFLLGASLFVHFYELVFAE